MIFLLQFGINEVHSPYRLAHFCWSLKNLLVLIYSKFHSKLMILDIVPILFVSKVNCLIHY